MSSPYGPHITEPSADIRAAANTAWQIYCAFVTEGFSPEQAVYLVAQTVHGGGSRRSE